MDGFLLADRFRLVRLLGEGGMGQVWEAHDQSLGRTVAVKLVSALAGGGNRVGEARARFLREARLTAALQHPNIVTVHDLDEAATAEGTTPFLVMELVRGQGLGEILRRGPVALADAARWGLQVSAALGEAHGAGILHRDIKPANIIVGQSGTVKVLDFGIARAADPALTRDRLTQNGFVVGTPQYMAPEQARGHAEQRSDLYALGCLLFEMITGRLPFHAPDDVSYLVAHLSDPPPAPSSVAGGIPAAWDELVLTLLRKDPGDRYGSAAELAERLRELADGAGHPPKAPDSGARSGRTADRKPPTPGPGARFAPRYLRTIEAEGPVRTVSFSPDSSRLAFTQNERPASVTDRTGRQLFRLGEGAGRLADAPGMVAFSPGGRWLATAHGDRTLRLWDSGTGREARRISHRKALGGPAFSPDGTRIAVLEEGRTLRLWDTGTGEVVSEARLNGTHQAIAFSPDGARVATAQMGFWLTFVTIVNAADGRELLKFKLASVGNDLFSLAFSPDGARLAACGGRKAAVYEVNTGRELLTVAPDKSRYMCAVAFSPDGDRLATGSLDGSTRVWDSRTGEELLKITRRKPVNCVAFSPDGTLLATGSDDATVQLWALTGDAEG